MQYQYLVIAGKPTASGRMGRLLSKDVNRHHASAWYRFNSIEAANTYADDMMKRHPRWTVAVVNMISDCGPFPGEQVEAEQAHDSEQ